MQVLTMAPSSPQVHWRRSRVFDRGVAAVCCQLVREAPAAELSQLDETEETRARPLGLNTVQLLKTCSAALGLGAHAAMRIAEGLYLDGRNRTLRDCILTKSQRDCTLTNSQRDCTLASGSRTHDCD
jgi:DNA topoisomerase IA